jgi:hypothetical protein
MPIHRMPIHRMPIHRQPNSLTVSMSLLGVNSSTDIFIDSLQEPTLVAPDHSILGPTVWLDGARPANACIPPSFPCIRHEIMPTNKFIKVVMYLLDHLGGHWWALSDYLRLAFIMISLTYTFLIFPIVINHYMTTLVLNIS